MGFLNSVKVCNVFMDMYGKCGFVGEVRCLFEMLEEKSVVLWMVVLDVVVKWEGLENGREVFDGMFERNVVVWMVMVVGYVVGGFIGEVLDFLEEMVFKCGYCLNFVIFCLVLLVCA